MTVNLDDHLLNIVAGHTLMKENANKLAIIADNLNDVELKEESDILLSQIENFEYSQSKIRVVKLTME